MEETTLQIQFENKKLVELNQFTLSLNALSQQYESFLKRNYPSSYNKETRKLYIVKVEHGSIIVELAGMVFPLIQDTNTIIEFYNYIKSALEYLTGKNESERKYSNQELRYFHSFLNPVANDQGSVMILQTKEGNVFNNNFYISYLDSNVAQNTINKIVESQKQESENTFYQKVCFQWASASFPKSKTVLDKIVIDNISVTPLKALFLNESDKISATTNNPKFPDNNWQDLIYVADVEVCYISGRLTAYRIIKLYTEETFII